MNVRRAFAVSLAALAVAAAGCGGDDEQSGDDGGGESLRGQTIAVWTNEFQPDRLETTEQILADFTEETGIRTRLVPVPEDQFATLITNAAAAGDVPDVVMGTALQDSHAYAAQDVFDPQAAQEVIDRLGPDTFSQEALELVRRDGVATGVPSDGWGQLLIYRRDLFDDAGLEAPETVEDIRAAAERLHGDGMVGVTLGTAPGDAFTAQTFEHVALAMGCQIIDDGGAVTFDSPECVEALRYYGELARDYSVSGAQDVESTRATYFAGRAAMIFWSPFILDGMAGLRDDTRPSCRQCRRNRAYLAENSGIVGPLQGADGQASQFGELTTFNIGVGGNVEAAQALVEYMMSDGYLRWLGLSPQGKYPVRLGPEPGSEEYADAWEELESGVDRHAPLRQFYSAESIASIREGVQSFQRWGFAQDQGALVGALGGDQPIADAVAGVIDGGDPGEVAEEAQAVIEEIQSSLE